MDDERFSVYFHHGGTFKHIGGEPRLYGGGIFQRKDDFDVNKIGYFSIVNEIKKLGYEKWNCIAYKVPCWDKYPKF